ncbi:pyrimidine reductase family protein [Microbacterium mangrovi]|nr:pyrimidine reductase family protein [Microbacterium mangrovi]
MPTRSELLDAYALPDRARPRIRVNFITSADGAVTLGGRSGPLGGATDRTLVQVLRTMADVVLVGAGTVRAEGYGGLRVADEDARWRRAHGLADPPALAVVSGTLDLDPHDAVFADAVRRPVVLTTQAAAAARGRLFADVADVVVGGASTVDLPAVVSLLASRGWTQTLCEGGPTLFGAMLDAGLVDEVCLTVAPRFVGGDATRIVRAAAEADREFGVAGILHDDDGFLFVRYRRPS